MSRTKVLTAAIYCALILGSVVAIGLGDRYNQADALANILKTKMTVLPQALSVSEAEGQPLSAKFEMEGGHLQLVVYATKDGKFVKIIVEPATGMIARVEALPEDKIGDAKAQSTVLTKAKIGLKDVVHVAMQDRGMRAVSVMPDMKDGHPVAAVSVLMGGHGNELKTVSEPMD